MSLEHLILVFVAFGLGGILKGATGSGAPFVAVPLMAILVDIQFAVAVFVVPNLISNAWQIWRFRDDAPEKRFAFSFAAAGVIGAGIGTIALAKFSGTALIIAVALIVLIYVAFRLKNPGWSLAWPTAQRLLWPVGAIGGFFQGAIGLSAPISVTFVNATGLAREQFIFTMSLFFFAMALIQLPAQAALDVMTWDRFGYSLLGVLPLLLGMWGGDVLGRKISKATFDRIVLGVLTLLALRLLAQALF